MRFSIIFIGKEANKIKYSKSLISHGNGDRVVNTHSSSSPANNCKASWLAACALLAVSSWPCSQSISLSPRYVYPWEGCVAEMRNSSVCGFQDTDEVRPLRRFFPSPTWPLRRPSPRRSPASRKHQPSAACLADAPWFRLGGQIARARLAFSFAPGRVGHKARAFLYLPAPVTPLFLRSRAFAYMPFLYIARRLSLAVVRELARRTFDAARL